MRIEILEPHGLCAGVNAAIARALRLKDVYCLHELVHSEIVVAELRKLGYRFVERVEDVPEGATVVFSAHGVSPQVRAVAARRGLKVVDATCPFVARVHRAARAFSERGLPVVIIGDPRHVEVRGVAGECANARVWNGGALPRAFAGGRIGVVSQTTMNADDVAERIAELRRRHEVETMAEVCNATKERQDAVKAFCRRTKAGAGSRVAVLVLGSRSSSNSRRLAEVAAANGAKALMAGTMEEVGRLDLEGVSTLGVTSGASTPERFFDEAVRFLRDAPGHVAIVMDADGRTTSRGAGCPVGAKPLADLLRWCGERGIRHLTIHPPSAGGRTRSTETGLRRLVRTLGSRTLGLGRNGVRFRMIGRRGDLPPDLAEAIRRLEERTRHGGRTLVVAISYDGRSEIVDAMNAAMARGEPLTEETFRRHLYAPDVPDPDLVIHTGGMLVGADAMLWETARSERHFTDVRWADFTEEDFDRALAAYARRRRMPRGIAAPRQ